MIKTLYIFQKYLINFTTALKGRCFYFLKTSGKVITTANVVNEVNFGVIEAGGSAGLLGGVQQLLTKVMIPALKAQENWGNLSAVKDEDGNSNKRPEVRF